MEINFLVEVIIPLPEKQVGIALRYTALSSSTTLTFCSFGFCETCRVDDRPVAGILGELMQVQMPSD